MANILIMDDEEYLLKMLAAYLRSIGHTITACASTESALEQFTARDGGIDVLIADVFLNGVSGLQFGADLHGKSPALKILFISGYPRNMWNLRDSALLDGLPNDSVRLLQKPFLPPALRTMVEELLERPLPGARAFRETGTA